MCAYGEILADVSVRLAMLGDFGTREHQIIVGMCKSKLGRVCMKRERKDTLYLQPYSDRAIVPR